MIKKIFNKIFEFIKKNILYIIIINIILFTHIYNFLNTNNYIYTNHFNKQNFIDNKYDTIAYYNEIIIQEFTATRNNLNKINIYLLGNKDYKNDNTRYVDGYFKISIEDKNHNIIEQHKYDKIFFDKNGAFSFEFKTIKNSIDKNYYLKIEVYHPVNLHFIAIEKTDKNTYFEKSKLKINNKLTEGNLLITTVYKNDNGNTMMLFVILTTTISIIFITMLYMFKKNKFPDEKQYLMLSIFVSLLMIFLSPPLSGHDELGHWARVYELGEGNLTTDTQEEWLYTEIPEGNIMFSKYIDIPHTLKQEKFPVLIEMQYTSVYSIVSYIPQIIGLKVAQTIFLDNIFWTYFVRIFEAAFCIVCTCFAIKIIPVGKKILFYIALLPPYVQATSFISADAMLVSSSVLLIAKILQLAGSNKKIKYTDYILLFVLSCILALSKLVYIPLCLSLIYLIYKRKETTKPIIIILILTILITIFWNIVAMNNLIMGQGGNTKYYINKIFKDPFEFLQLLSFSYLNQIGNHINDLFGGKNLWHDNIIYDSTIYPLLFFIMYLYLLNKGKHPLKQKEKNGLILIILATITLISTSLYIACTPVGHNQIIGIQGRYFLPLLLPIYLIIPKKQDDNKINISIFLSIIYYSYYLNLIINYL